MKKLTREENAVLNREEMRAGSTVLQSLPRIASIGLTLRCNLNCIMCFTQKMAKKDMDAAILANAAQLFPTLEEARWNDAGELFASKNSSQYLSMINGLMVPKSYLSSNFKAAGQFMDDILAGGLTHLSVSIDAATPDTYHAIRRGGDFEELVVNLEKMYRLKQARGLEHPFLTLVFVVMQRNLAELPDFVDLAHRVGAREIHVLRLLPNPAGIDQTESVSIETLRPFYRAAWKRASGHGIRLSHIAYTDDELLGPDERRASDTPGNASPEVISGSDAFCRGTSQFAFGGFPFCHSPWTEMLIDVDGKVRPCCYHPVVLGDLARDSVLDIWNNDAYQDFRRRILEHDFIYCHHCPWLHKVFHYHGPAGAGEKHPLARRLEALERSWELKEDIVRRSHPFTDIKIEMDPLAFRLNKEWDLGELLANPSELLQRPELDVARRDDLERQMEMWRQDTDEALLERAASSRNPLTRVLKRLIVKAVRFYAGVRFSRQREFNLRMLQSMSELHDERDRLINYIEQLHGKLDNQKHFNALVVQYINGFSDRIFDRLERQKTVNRESLHAFGQTNERIDGVLREHAAIVRMMGLFADRIEKPSMAALTPLPRTLEAMTTAGRLALDSTPARVQAAGSFSIRLSVINESHTVWSASTDCRTGIDYRWYDKTSGARVLVPHQPVWLDSPLSPGTTITIDLEVIAPDRTGRYELHLSLITPDEQWFPSGTNARRSLAMEVI